jgi:hypothetical protein
MSATVVTVRRIGPLARELALAALRLVGIGLLAIGVSGMLAFGFGLVAGRAFVAGDAPGVTHSAQSCREFHEDAPHARTCAEAAAKHHFADVIWDRVGAGAVGGLLLAVALALGSRRRAGSLLRLPETLVPTIATLTFSVVGVWLVDHGLTLTLRNSDTGGGGYLSAGLVAIVLGVWFAIETIQAVSMEPFATDR